jgi:hypothetical protein
VTCHIYRSCVTAIRAASALRAILAMQTARALTAIGAKGPFNVNWSFTIYWCLENIVITIGALIL